MGMQVQFRRGTETEHETFTGAEGEITVDTTNKTAVVHDGSTAGGHRLATNAGLVAGVAEAKTYTDDSIAPVTTQLAATANLNDRISNQVVSGLSPATSASLTSNISAGIAYVSGKRVAKDLESHTYTASKDTYIDLDSTGAYTFVEVSNGANIPAITADCVRVGKAVTGVAAITFVASYGYSTAYGRNALSHAGTAGHATAFGFEALKNNLPTSAVDTGQYNSAFGYSAMKTNTIGHHCSAFGWNALAGNTEGNSNSGFGEDALLANTTGSGNTAVGAHALYQVQTASSNTAIGNMALGNNTSGYYNTAIGESSGISSFGSVGDCASDYNMTFVGALASVDKSVNAGPFHNSTAIGAGSRVNNSNMIKLGSTSVTSVQTNGDYEALDIGDGFICKSPDGTRYRITVANGGTVSVAAA